MEMFVRFSKIAYIFSPQLVFWNEMQQLKQTENNLQSTSRFIEGNKLVTKYLYNVRISSCSRPLLYNQINNIIIVCGYLTELMNEKGNFNNITVSLIFFVPCGTKGLCLEHKCFLKMLLTRQVFQNTERQYILFG